LLREGRKMLKINILYVEHEDLDINNLKSALKEFDFKIHVAKDVDEIDQYIDQLPLDLVITDIFWPNPNEGKEISRLEEIINKIQKVNSVVPIVALSGRPEAQKEALQPKYKGKLFDLWSKNAGYAEFLTYRVKNLIESRQRKLGEDVLLQTILRVVKDNPEAWEKDKIEKFINNYYVKIASIGVLFDGIKEFFTKMVNQSGIDFNYADKTFGSFSELDPSSTVENVK
jgi:CheY-like chemotaxis protein